MCTFSRRDTVGRQANPARTESFLDTPTRPAQKLYTAEHAAKVQLQSHEKKTSAPRSS